jgi:hypothetical protein
MAMLINKQKFPILYLQPGAQMTRYAVSKLTPSNMLNGVHAVSAEIDGLHTDNIHEKYHGSSTVATDRRKVHDIGDCLIPKLLTRSRGKMREFVVGRQKNGALKAPAIISCIFGDIVACRDWFCQ